MNEASHLDIPFYFRPMKNLITFFLVMIATLLAAQEKHTISGIVTDEESGETLIGASIYVISNDKGTSTNEYGFYSITMDAADSVLIAYSYVGYQNKVKRISLQKNIKIDVSLGTGIDLAEVVVKANSFQEQLRSTEMGVENISTKEAKLLPALLGEVDIIKTIQLKPGIVSGSEGSSGLFVRGGGNDQNLIVLDEAIVYNPNHLFGFFSTFNSDAIKDLKVYKAGFPAQYGGRLSSVIDVKLKEGNNKKYTATGGIGIISSRLTLEGPIQKDKSSFIVSGRRTYADIITRQINKSNEDKEDFNPIPDYYFYDLNTKMNFKLSEKDHLYVSGYFGRDDFGFQSDNFDFSFDWGNATGTARWNHIFNPKLFANTTFTFSDYQYNIKNDLTGFTFELGSKIQDINLKTDFYNNLNEKNTLRFGGNITYHKFEVGRLSFGSDDNTISFSSGTDFDGIEFGAYAGDEIVLSDKLKVNAGLRLSGFTNEGEFYFGVEPRVSSNFALSDKVALKGSYARMNQYLHLVANSSVALPTDIWYPSTKNVKPQASDQVSLGWTYLPVKNILITNEFYYKKLHNQIDFKDFAQLFANDALEDEFRFGDGYSYGVELGVEKQEGDLTGWIGYTLSWTQRRFNGIQENRYYSPRYDRRHDLSIVAIYEINKRLSVTGTFVYGSGDVSWLPSGRFYFQDIPGNTVEPVVPSYGDRNTFRLAPYHRLDLGLVWRFFPRWGEHDLTLSVFNALDRRNPYFVYLDTETTTLDQGGVIIEDVPNRIVAKQVSLFPIIPSITWNFSF